MAAFNKGLISAILAILLCAVACCGQDMASDFDQSVQMLPKQPKWPSGRVMYYDMAQSANEFVSQHNDDLAAKFLENKLEDPNSRKFALLSLAKLAASNQTAENVLYDVIQGQNRVFQKDAVTAIAYLDSKNGQRICETLLSQPGSYKVRKPAVEMLVAFGDQDTLELFEQMQSHEENSFVKQALDSAIPQLKYRLTKVSPDRQAEWVQEEILSWRTLREMLVPLAGGVNHLAAQTLNMQGKHFSREYLQYKLSSGDLLGIAIIGGQKEAWAIESLKSHAPLDSSLGDAARGALAQIGTSEALRALEDSLIPGEDSRGNKHIMILLQYHGDKISAEFMKKLSSDERFSEDQQARFDRIYKIIERRLSGEGSPRTRRR